MNTVTTIHIPNAIAIELLNLAGFYYDTTTQRWINNTTGDWYWMRDEALLIALEFLADHATI